MPNYQTMRMFDYWQGCQLKNINHRKVLFDQNPKSPTAVNTVIAHIFLCINVTFTCLG
jgi:hypothetical protein